MNTLLRLIRLIWEHRQEIIQLLEQLPETLKVTGESIEKAGTWALTTSDLLSTREPNEITLSWLLNKLNLTIINCEQKLRDVIVPLNQISNCLALIRVPEITPVTKRFDILDLEVVVGINCSWNCPFPEVIENLRQMSLEITDTVSQLNEVSGYLDSLGDFADKTADHAKNIGKALETGGQKLQTVFEE